jgi:hypothetical protein
VKTVEVIEEMLAFFGDDEINANHALKVYGYTEVIADGEGFNDSTPEKEDELAALLYAAILHDVACKPVKEQFGSCTFKQQEEEGPPIAEEILTYLEIPAPVIERAKWLIGHHHSPDACEDKDFRILLEADYIVNLEEGFYPMTKKDEIVAKRFRTASGKNVMEKALPNP